MSLTDLLNENREIITGNTPIINYDAFNVLTAKYGKEVALGYILCMADMKSSLKEILVRRYEEGSMPETPTFIKKKNEHLSKEFVTFLDEIVKSGVFEEPQFPSGSECVQIAPS